MLIAERLFISKLVNVYGSHPVVSTDEGIWYPQKHHFLKEEYHLNSSVEKSIIERTIQYIKVRTESFESISL